MIEVPHVSLGSRQKPGKDDELPFTDRRRSETRFEVLRLDSSRPDRHNLRLLVEVVPSSTPNRFDVLRIVHFNGDYFRSLPTYTPKRYLLDP